VTVFLNRLVLRGQLLVELFNSVGGVFSPDPDIIIDTFCKKGPVDFRFVRIDIVLVDKFCKDFEFLNDYYFGFDDKVINHITNEPENMDHSDSSKNHVEKKCHNR